MMYKGGIVALRSILVCVIHGTLIYNSSERTIQRICQSVLYKKGGQEMSANSHAMADPGTPNSKTDSTSQYKAF